MQIDRLPCIKIIKYNTIYLDGFIRTKPNTKMKVKNAAVYWNFKKRREKF